MGTVSAINSGDGSAYCSEPTDSFNVHLVCIPYCSFMEEGPIIHSLIQTVMISDADSVRFTAL